MIKKTATSKILSLCLALCLTVGLLPGMSLTAYAAAGDTNAGANVGAGTWANGSGGAGNHRSFYFGTYNSKPILWRMLESNGTTEALMLSEEILTEMPFKDVKYNIWKDSDIRTYLNDTSTGFISKLPSEISSKLTATSITEAGQTTNDKVYLLSTTEATALSDGDRNLGAAYWLRSQGNSNFYAAIVSFAGYVSSVGTDVDTAIGVRPAIKIDQSADIFTDASSADGSNSAPYTLDSGTPVTLVADDHVKFSVDSTDITWKVIDVSGNIATLLPTTSIGSIMKYRDLTSVVENKWSESDIFSFLNPAGAYTANTFAFDAVEEDQMQSVSITETGDSATPSKLFLLSLTDANKNTYFADYTDRAQTFGGSPAWWWLRSPGDAGYTASNVDDAGVVSSGGGHVDIALGVRPAFKLNPSSVIFTSEIKSGADATKGETAADANYSAAVGGGAKNFKLTLADAALTAGAVTAGGDVVDASTHPTKSVTPGGTVSVVASGATGGTKLTYKIVNSSNSLVGYGQGTDTAVTVNATANVTGGGNLPNGSYTVYVWAQKDNATTSNTGSAPLYFNLTMTGNTGGSGNNGNGGGGGSVAPTVDSAKAIADIGKAPAGGTVTVAMNGTTNAPASILDAAKGKDVNVVFNYGSYSWTVNGKSIGTIPAGRITYDLSVKSINSSVISALAGDSGVLQLEITHSGSLPFTAALTYDVSAAHNGKTLYLYYYNETSKRFEYQTSGTVSGGKIKLDFTHASQYVLTDKRIDKVDNPNTGAYNPFTDVSENDWFFNAVMIAYDQGLFSGTAADKFSPGAPMTRAMFATVLARLDGVDLSGYTASNFSDVAISAWYGPAVAWAADKGITGGVGGGLYAPDKSITREEMAVMLYNYIQKTGKSLPAKLNLPVPFADETVISPWAKDAVSAMQSYGLINGVGGNKYNPKGTATRAEVAQIFLNYLNATVE